MRALTVLPASPGSGALIEIAEPEEDEGSVLVATRAIGICGTDREILAGEYGQAPPAEQRLVLGHESLGEVLSAPADSGLSPGDRVVGVVRRPDPVPCLNCAIGEFAIVSQWPVHRARHHRPAGIRPGPMAGRAGRPCPGRPPAR